MFTRGLAVCLTLVMVSGAHAGAIVELVPGPSANAFNPCGYYDPGETATVAVYLSQSPAATARNLRLVQLDFNASDAALGLPGSVNWEATVNHFAYDDGSKRLSDTYFAMGVDAAEQLVLPADGTRVKVGAFNVTLPGAVGDYVLDVLNAAATHSDEGGQVRFGFGLPATDPITAWRADTGDLTGGAFTFEVIDQAVAIGGADPALGETLWRSIGNVARITMDRDIVVPGPGEVEVRELLPGGALGADLSASFSFSLDAINPRILVVLDTAPLGSLAHRSWYTIRSTGAWAAASPFKVHYEVQLGDANQDGRVTNADLGTIYPSINCFSNCVPRHDINGDGRVQNSDLGTAYPSINSFAVSKPDGHDCE